VLHYFFQVARGEGEACHVHLDSNGLEPHPSAAALQSPKPPSVPNILQYMGRGGVCMSTGWHACAVYIPLPWS